MGECKGLEVSDGWSKVTVVEKEAQNNMPINGKYIEEMKFMYLIV